MWVEEGEGDRWEQPRMLGNTNIWGLLGRRGKKPRKKLKRYRTREKLREAFKKQSVSNTTNAMTTQIGFANRVIWGSDQNILSSRCGQKPD